MVNDSYVRKKGPPDSKRGHAHSKDTSTYISLIEDHLEYVRATATAKAVEIGQHTGRLADIEDYKQEIFCYLIEHIEQYDSLRSQPKTFINMIIRFAKKEILRRLYRQKRRVCIEAVTIEPFEMTIIDERTNNYAEIAEFIETLSEPDRTICYDLFIQGYPTGIVARRFGRNKAELLMIVRQALRPLADRFGIKDYYSRATNDGENNGQITNADGSPPASAPARRSKGTSQTRLCGLPLGK